MGKLIVLDGIDKGKTYFLRTRNIIGRHSECSFHLNDKGISGNHCKIDKINLRDFEIVDLNSSNGTFVNNKRVLKQKLKFGDVISLGSIRMIFQPISQVQNDSTMMINMQKFMNEAGELVHCGKPLAKEWNFCPYCGRPLKDDNV